MRLSPLHRGDRRYGGRRSRGDLGGRVPDGRHARSASASFVDRIWARQARSFASTPRPTSLDPTCKPTSSGCRSAWERRGPGYYIPVKGPIWNKVLDTLRRRGGGPASPLLTNPATEKVGQNLKYDMLVLQPARDRDRRAGHRHDGPELPARKRRTEPQPRPALATAPRTIR